MDRVIVITDIDTKLGCSLIRTYREAGEIAVGISPVKKADLEYSDLKGNDYEIIEWNRNSLIDSKSAILEIIKKYKTIDEVLLVQSIPEYKSSLADIEFSTIDRNIDYWVKGNIYFVREVLRLFAEKESGTLALINHSLSDEKNRRTPLSETVQSAFSGLTKSLLPLYAGKDVCINAFESVTDSPEELARFIYKNMCERFRKVSGKTASFQSGKNLFSALKK
jgi:hypothetical protein